MKEKGFSIVEVLIVTGLMGALALGGMTLMKNQFAAQKTVEQNYEVTTTLQQIRSVINHKDNCTETFKNLNPGTGSVTVLKKMNSAGTFDNVYPTLTPLTGGINVLSYQLDSSLTGLAANQTALKILFSRGASSIKDSVQKNIKLEFELDGSGNISSCSATSDNSRLGSPGICDPSTEGTIAYDYTNHRFVVCAGNPPSWTGTSSVPVAQAFSVTGGSGQTTALLAIPGSWSICSFSGFKTTADDKDVYDGCYVEQLGPGSWRIRVSKHSNDSLTCLANCVNL